MKFLKVTLLVLAASCATAALAVAHPLKTAYPPSSQPMVSGTIESVNDHALTLHTDEGETMTFVIDSHSVVPEHMEPGMRESIEFRAMQSGEFLAQRIVPLRHEENRNTQTTVNTGELDQDRYAMRNGTGEAMGYAQNGGNGEENAETASQEQREEANEHELPQTASNEPLLLLLGMGSLLGGAALWMARRRHA